RVIAAAGLTKPRRHPTGYVPKGVPYPARLAPEPGTTHQIDLVGPRHLDGGVELHALNLIDIGSHTAASEILAATRPNLIADAVIAMWGRVGIPAVAQFDNASNFGGAIPPAWQHFGPVVAVCLDLDVIPRFIPQREPWRNGVVELSTTCGTRAFPARNASPASTVSEPRTKLSWRSTTPSTATRPRRGQPRRISAGRLRFHPVAAYRAPTLVPARGRIEVVRYVRSNRILDLFGKRVTLDAEDAHHVTAVIKVRSKTVQAITVDGEIVHQGDFNLARTLR
ncbi:MAG: putative transposase, partial [Acidimicrobiaceae bacterium]|nr:putative transposase [Acidimicrobiaceae bacterium]